VTAVARARFCRSDWLALGLEHLAAGGPEALTIDRLAAAAGRSKGSFYHHFADQPGFIAALLDYWTETHTARVIDGANAGLGDGSRRSALDDLVGRLDPRVEIGIRRLAAVDTQARTAAKAVDQARMAYLAQLNAEDLCIDAGRAQQIAEFDYAAYVGAQFLFGDDPISWQQKGAAMLAQSEAVRAAYATAREKEPGPCIKSISGTGSLRR
jgi:AcrR family transcriptional regulator